MVIVMEHNATAGEIGDMVQHIESMGCGENSPNWSWTFVAWPK
jgi:hypothetical protein